VFDLFMDLSCFESGFIDEPHFVLKSLVADNDDDVLIYVMYDILYCVCAITTTTINLYFFKLNPITVLHVLNILMSLDREL